MQLLLHRREEAVEIDVQEGEAVTTPASKLAGDPGAVGLESIGHTASVANQYIRFLFANQVSAGTGKGKIWGFLHSFAQDETAKRWEQPATK
jgi:hypothetical protein